MTEAKKLTTEPSTICKDGTAEWSQSLGRRWPFLQTKQMKRKGERPGTGDRLTVGHVLVRQPQGKNEKMARSWDPHQFAPEYSCFLALAQSAWRLFVITTPNNNALAGNSRNGRGLIQVSILLALVIEGNINICHPTCNWAVRLRTFLVEATAATNDDLLGA